MKYESFKVAYDEIEKHYLIQTECRDDHDVPFTSIFTIRDYLEAKSFIELTLLQLRPVGTY
jgi:hypothetical protein